MDQLLDEAAKPNRPAGSMSCESISYGLGLHMRKPAKPLERSADEEADSLRTNAYNKALSVKDEFFHFELYDWYLSRGLSNQLLEVRDLDLKASRHQALTKTRTLQTRTSYLEAFLSREPTTLEKTDLLWQYYVRTGRFAAAASVLAALADTSAFPLALHQRVEYLSLAVGNAKSQVPSTSRGDTVQFLTEIEEKLEVAQVQIEIFRAIEEGSLPQDEKQQWLDKVEDRLFTISEVCRSLLRSAQPGD